MVLRTRLDADLLLADDLVDEQAAALAVHLDDDQDALLERVGASLAFGRPIDDFVIEFICMR